MKSHSILIVDDETAYCEVLAEILESSGYRVFTAARAKEALDVLEAHPIDLIMTDVMMPEIDGLTFIRLIRESQKYAHIPVLVVSAKLGYEDQADAVGAGANGFLAKPFTTNELEGTIQNQLPVTLEP
jgi:CheY-like chemotaxis protein